MGLADKVKQPTEVKVQKEEKLKVNVFSFTKEEIGFILAKLAQIEFKGVEIEFTYNLILKLQEQYKSLKEEKEE
jgi:hypothetical protein